MMVLHRKVATSLRGAEKHKTPLYDPMSTSKENIYINKK